MSAALKRQPGACTCGGADERTLWRLRRLGGLSAAAVELAEIIGRKAQAEAMAEADRLDADIPPAPEPDIPPAEPAAALAAAALAAAPPDRIAAPDPAPPPEPPLEPDPGARPPAAWNAPRRIGWTVLFMRVSREARRIDALETAVEKAARAAKSRAACPEAAAPETARSEPSRPEIADPPAADDPRMARIRVLALEAARADPGDRDLQDLAAQIDVLLYDGMVQAGLDVGDAVADLAADVCADLGIAFDFQGLRPEDLDPSDPDDPVWQRDPAPD